MILHQVVGVIFNHRVAIGHNKNEAVQIDDPGLLQRVEVSHRIKEDSAIPLALPGQIVIGGKIILPQELGQHKDALVALQLDDGSSIFKRVGNALPGSLSHLRQFESIGGLGTSLILSLGKPQPGIKSVQAARLISGVLYHG